MRRWSSSIAAAAAFSLLVVHSVQAMNIPSLSVIEPGLAAAQPELAKRRQGLLKERKALLDRANRHNDQCTAVEAGSGEAARCDKALSALNTAIGAHVQASEQYNNDHVAAELALKAQALPPHADPNVVDARRPYPSSSIDSAIAKTYSNSPPGVADRVRKGFQAVMDRDWKVAKAWFEDALNRDPGNANLKRLVALVADPAAVPPAKSADPQGQPGREPVYMKGSDGSMVAVPADYLGNVRTYSRAKDGAWLPLPMASEMFPATWADPPAPRAAPNYRMDKDGKMIELPADYMGAEATFIRGKDGAPIPVPSDADVKLLFPGDYAK
jgi:hypothetical protein